MTTFEMYSIKKIKYFVKYMKKVLVVYFIQYL